MKFLIISDSHGLNFELQQFLERYRETVDAIIHCGDSELFAKQFVQANIYAVRGNCDFDSSFPEEITEEFGALRVFITHGHRYNVKMSYVPLSYRADELGANLVCFGHSHVAVAFVEQGTLYINPGSIRQARGRRERTYCILEWIDETSAHVSFFEFGTDKEVKDLSQTFQF